MSSPARTYFCGNGHVKESYVHGEFGECNEGKIKCFCGNEESYMLLNWADPDYCGICCDDENVIVCNHTVHTEPIGYDEKECEDFKGNKYYIKIGRYDMSNLKNGGTNGKNV